MTEKMRDFKERLKKNQTLCYGRKPESEDYIKCRRFFNEISRILNKKYIMVESCNKDLSKYLVVIGTENQISYNGKPDKSFRISDHWNWYSNTKKCYNIDEVQCYSLDVQEPLKRDPNHPNNGTNPRFVCQVAYYSKIDKKYHAVYGNVWNKDKRIYEWIEADPVKVITGLLL